MSFDGFHLLRPELAWLAIPLLISVLLYLRGRQQQRQWRDHIDPALLPYLLHRGNQSQRSVWPATLVAALCFIALLGPSWEKVPSPVQRNTAGLVIVFDLSPSMLAEDVQPSRLQRAKFAVRDILRLREDGQTGLVAFAGDAFVVAPLTDDTNTLNTLLPALHPGMMPLAGSNPLSGLQTAAELLARAEVSNSKILLISDGIESWQMPALLEFAQASQHPLSILGVGTEAGAPIPLAEGGFAQNERGDIIVATLATDYFKELASQGRGQYFNHQHLSEAALQQLVSGPLALAESEDSRRFEQWRDGGVWFSLLLIPLALLAYQRGTLAVVVIALLWQPQDTLASPWQTNDQRGAALLEEQPAAAAKVFDDPMWQGVAHYRAGEFDAAARAFAEVDSSDAHYNRGNALARAGQLDQALAAYERALELEPEHRDAASNKALLEQLQQQQQQQQDQENQQEQQSDDSSQNGDSSGQQDSSRQDSSGNDQQQGEPSSDSNNAQRSDDAQQKVDSPKDDASQQEQTSEAPSGDEQSREEQQQLAEQHARSQDEHTDSAEQTESTKQQAAQAQPTETGDGEEQTQNSLAAGTQPLSEEQQAQEQWLRNIPDSSDQLLRNKFNYQYLQRRRRGEVPERENYAPY